jgi:hypothetical protein
MQKTFSVFLEKFRRVTSGGNYMPEIDGLRFIAIVWVAALMHLTNIIDINIYNRQLIKTDFTRSFLLEGGNGVSFFFMISGFILALPFIKEKLYGGNKVIQVNQVRAAVYRSFISGICIVGFRIKAISLFCFAAAFSRFFRLYAQYHLQWCFKCIGRGLVVGSGSAVLYFGAVTQFYFLYKTTHCKKVDLSSFDSAFCAICLQSFMANAGLRYSRSLLFLKRYVTCRSLLR